MSEAEAPWSVELVGSGKWRFTNISGQRAVMITMSGVGSEFETEVPSPLSDGEHFDMKLPAGTGLEVRWSTEQMRHRSWTFDGVSEMRPTPGFRQG